MISCNQYDYIEIVCLYHYPIKLTLKSGKIIECTAQDTKRNENREECILVSMESSSSQELIILDEISVLEVAVSNPHFQKVTFD
ncbi:Rho-binding antiterminator [Vibrio makurazakiensis]|uniref:Rho-binding antiterminator n=1 Tax=Vibrio makurazakiensis TaxID=2910250 RepID=UPI003D10E344